MRVADLEGTYLMWIDLSAYMDPEELKAGGMERIMEDECGIAADYGAWFGGDEYAGCIRLNLATRRENVELAAERLIKAFKK